MSGTPSANAFNSADASNQFAIIQSYLISIYPYLYAARIRPSVSSYKHIIELYGQRNTAVMNKLAFVPGAFDFMDLTPDQMGQLVPKIRIYKQLYNSDGSPSQEIEFVVPSKINTDILLSDTTDQGLGIKNFQYRYIGSNPATVRNDIEAKLTLYFQNFSELLRVRYAPDGTTQYSFLDLFSRANKREQLGAAPASAAPMASTGRAAYQGGISAQNYEGMVGVLDPAPERDEYVSPIEFEIKVVVGWAVPKGSTTLTSQQIEAIEQSSQAFFLTLIDHDFSFEQDGSFSVELNYRARLGAIMDSPQLDILRLDTVVEAGDDAQTWLQDAGLVNIFEGSVADVINSVNIDLRNARYSCNNEVAEELQSRLDRLESNLRGARYRKIANELIFKRAFYAENIDAETLNNWANARDVGMEGRLPAYSNTVDSSLRVNRGGRAQDERDVSEAEIDETLGMLAGADDERRDEARDRRRDDYLDAGTPDFGPPSEPGSRGAAAGESIAREAAKRRDASYDPNAAFGDEEEREKRWEEAVKTAHEISEEEKNKDHKFIYFLFGDLLDYLIDEAKKSSPSLKDGILQQDLEKIKILVGSCDLGNPSGDTYPITHIPISWEAFRNFWYKRVIKPKRDKYPLVQFIRDAIRELIFGAINSVYYNANSRRFTNTFKSAFISLPKTSEGSDPIRAASLSQNLQGRIIDLDQYTVANPLSLMNHRVKTQDMYHYMCIFVEDGKKGQFSYQSMLDADYTSRRAYNQKELNIHHFGFGEDRGVLKSANFSKTDQPYLRESRYLERGGDPLIQLSNVYEASITLFGAPFFYPGQYIWITPYGLSKSRNTAYRLGSPDAGPGENGERGSIANLMGLGGYHIIIDVEGIIEDGLYEVKINARFDNSGATLGDREGYGAKIVKRCENRVPTAKI